MITWLQGVLARWDAWLADVRAHRHKLCLDEIHEAMCWWLTDEEWEDHWRFHYQMIDREVARKREDATDPRYV